jgi:hypothetical protein
MRASAARVVVAEIFKDVVLDERVGEPAIDGEVAIARAAPGAAVRDVSGV